MGMKRESPVGSEAPRKRQVLVVDDHTSVRMSLRFVINGEPDMVVCGEAEDAQPALAMAERLCPDIVIADIALKKSHGLDLIRDLHTRYPSLPVFVHSAHSEELYAPLCFECGARGYGPVLTNSVAIPLPNDTDLPDAVRTVWSFPGDTGTVFSISIASFCKPSLASGFLVGKTLQCTAGGSGEVVVATTLTSSLDIDTMQWSITSLNTTDNPALWFTFNDSQQRFDGFPSSLSGGQQVSSTLTLNVPGGTQPGVYTGFLRIDARNASPVAYGLQITVTNVIPTVSAPNSPSNLACVATSSSQIDLTWTDESENEDGFEIQRSADGVQFGQIATVGEATTSYADTGLATCANYYYRVRAYNVIGNSDFSNVANNTTRGCITVPTAPCCLSVSIPSSSQIELAWQDQSDNENIFIIDRAESADFARNLVSRIVQSNIVVYSDTGLLPGVTYYYRARAGNSAGSSSNSSTVSVSAYGLWKAKYFTPEQIADENTSGDQADPDGDGLSNLQEFLTGTDPTNSASVFRIMSVEQESDNLRVTWLTVGSHTNAVQAAPNIDDVYSDVSCNIVITGTSDTTTNYLDLGAVTNSPVRFYRIRLVQ